MEGAGQDAQLWEGFKSPVSMRCFLCSQDEAFWGLADVRTRKDLAGWAFYTSTVLQQTKEVQYTKEVLPFPKQSSSRHGGCFQTGSQAGAAKQPGGLVTENTSAFQPNKIFASKLFVSLGQCLESHGRVI